MKKQVRRGLRLFKIFAYIILLSWAMIYTLGFLMKFPDELQLIQNNINILWRLIENYKAILFLLAFASFLWYILELLIRKRPESKNRKFEGIKENAKLVKAQKGLLNAAKKINMFKNKRYYEKASDKSESSIDLSDSSSQPINPSEYTSEFLNPFANIFNKSEKINVIKNPNTVSDISEDETWENSVKKLTNHLSRDGRISFLEDELKWVARKAYNIDYDKDPIEKIIEFENKEIISESNENQELNEIQASLE